VYKMKLNPEQLEAVMTVDGPLLVLAGAGSGKTRVVTQRIVHLLETGVAPYQILGLTFTNKAAGEMQERIQKATEQRVLVCTFHSLGARMLRESIEALGYSRSFVIYDQEDSDKLLRTLLKERKGELKEIRNAISKAKNGLQLSHEVSDQEIDDFSKIYGNYQAALKECNAVDFDDLLLLPVRILREHPAMLNYYQERWTHLLIDEYQDTNESQYTLVNLLVEKHHNLCVVGDPDQSIYSWRGANIQNILRFDRDYPEAKVIRLEQNYRSHTHILEAANELISFNSDRMEKSLWSDLGEGAKIRRFTALDEREEARFIAKQIRKHHDDYGTPLNDMVVFYRTNAQSRPFEDQFLSQQLPYNIVGGISFYQRREIKDILAFLRLAHSGSDFIAFERTVNIPKRGFGDATIEKIRFASLESRLPILSCCQAIVDGTSVKLTLKIREALGQYVSIIATIRRVMGESSLKETVISAIEATGYLSYLKEDRESFEERKENLDELIAKAAEWEISTPDPTLGAFLEELSLKSTLDESTNDRDRIQLMTVHNGKGLEFAVVFVAGLEEDLFPHANARGSEEALEEERRLCYVGMTRAKLHLYMTDTRLRYLWGMQRDQRPSRFLRELSPDHTEKVLRIW